MARGSGNRAVPVVTRSHAARRCKGMDRLPPEIVTEALEFLDLDDLRKAAAVSRTFYASAWRAGLYIHRNLRWECVEGCEEQLATFSEVVPHVLRKGLRLSFSFTFLINGASETQIQAAITGSTAQTIFALLSSALPVLVYLSVHVCNALLPNLASALQHAAPHLLELELSTDPDDNSAARDVLVDIFTGDAPKLDSVLLNDFPFGPEPVAVFEDIESVHLDFAEVFPDINFARHFPCVRVLHLGFFTEHGAAPPMSFKLDGLRLRQLIIDDCDAYALMPAILRSIKVGDVPNFEHIGNKLHWQEPLWQRRDVGELNIRLKPYMMLSSDVSVLVVPDHRRWRRAYHLHTWYLDYETPIADIPQLSERLVYLRLDNIYLVGLLESYPELTALREMQVDFNSNWQYYSALVWPPDWAHVLDGEFTFTSGDKSADTFAVESYNYIRCPALQKLTLFAVDAAMSVAGQEVAFLGRALFQGYRRKKDRAALELLGIELKRPVSRFLLQQTFSCVRKYEFTGMDSPADRDSGLWDDDML